MYEGYLFGYKSKQYVSTAKEVDSCYSFILKQVFDMNVLSVKYLNCHLFFQLYIIGKNKLLCHEVMVMSGLY